jgi:hypothetical protein
VLLLQTLSEDVDIDILSYSTLLEHFNSNSIYIIAPKIRKARDIMPKFWFISITHTQVRTSGILSEKSICAICKVREGF